MMFRQTVKGIGRGYVDGKYVLYQAPLPQENETLESLSLPLTPHNGDIFGTGYGEPPRQDSNGNVIFHDDVYGLTPDIITEVKICQSGNLKRVGSLPVSNITNADD